MKKYLFIIGSLKKGGAERNLSKVASHLSQHGHEVKIALYENIIDFPLDPRITIIDLNIMKYSKGWRRVFMIYVQIFLSVWRERPYKAITFTRLSGQFLAATLYPRTYVRYDVYPFYMKKRRWITSLILFNLPTVRKVISPSIELSNKLSPYFLNKSKVITISNPINKIEKKSQEFHPHQKPYFIVVGRLSSQKRLDIILKAFSASRAKDRFDLVILGDGSLSHSLQALAQSLGLQNQVHFKGVVSNPSPFIMNAFCLVLASDREGFPNVLIEALSVGTPVISSNCPTGPSEIIENGYNGFLFDKGNDQQLKHYIDKLADDLMLYTSVKKNCIDSVQRYSEHNIYGLWESILR